MKQNRQELPTAKGHQQICDRITLKSRVHIPLLWITAALSVQACTSEIVVRFDEPLNGDRILNFDQVNAALDTRSFTVTTTDSLTWFGEAANIAIDSMSFLDLQTRRAVSIPTRSVISIHSNNHTLGGVTGFALGALAGVGVLLVNRPTSHEAFSGLGQLIEAAACVLVGTTIGSIVGREEEFLFEQNVARGTK